MTNIEPVQLELRPTREDGSKYWVSFVLGNHVMIGGVEVHRDDLGNLFKLAIDGVISEHPNPFLGNSGKLRRQLQRSQLG